MYDPQANVSYISLNERQGDVKTVHVTANFLVEIDATGAAGGIELLNANDQLIAGDDGSCRAILCFPCSEKNRTNSSEHT